MSNSLPTKGCAITIKSIGTPHEVVLAKSYTIPEVGPEDVLLKVLACPINPSDTNQINGSYPTRPKYNNDFTDGPTWVAGLEGILEVLKVGKDVPDLKVGDWVKPADNFLGTWRSHAVVNYKGLTKPLPDIGADPVYLATSNINPVTAMQLLRNYVDLQAGDWFIINAGNSSVARAAIQIASRKGVKSISVVRGTDYTPETVSQLKALGVTEIITEEQSSDKDFDETIKGWVNGKLRLGLNCVGGQSGNNLMRHLSLGGKFVLFGGMTTDPMQIDVGNVIFKDVSIHGYWLNFTQQRDPAGFERDVAEVFRMIRSGELAKVPTVEFKLSPKNTDEENTKIAKDALLSVEQVLSQSKHVFVFE